MVFNIRKRGKLTYYYKGEHPTLCRGEVVWDRKGRSFPDWSGIF